MNRTELENLDGVGSVTVEPGALEQFSKDHSFTHGKPPSMVVRPTTVEGIKEVVNLMNEQGGKIVPVSSGPPRFRGDTVPEVDGAVVVDLSGMKEIMWINRRNRVTLVEAGVTFGELEPELEKVGLRCMMPLAPRSTKSIVGAYLEREPFTIPKYSWDLGDPVASSELILGDGYLMRTGGAKGPGTLEEQRSVGGAQKYNLGPLYMDVRKISQGSQGNMSICSWMSLRCELLPEVEKLFFIGADKLEDLIDFFYRSLYLRLVDEHYIVNSQNFACLVGRDPGEIQKVKAGLPEWIMVITIGGYADLPGDQFNYKMTDIRSLADKHGVKLLDEIGGVTDTEYLSRIVRKTSEAPYWKIRYKGDARELPFLTSAGRTPEFVKAAGEVAASKGFDNADIGVYIQMVLQGSACHCEFDLYSEPAATAGLLGLYTDMGRKLFNMGAYYSRPYDVLSDIVYSHDKYATFVKYARGMKDILDPNHVMNPGKLCFGGM